jgi:hypothetical protein
MYNGPVQEHMQGCLKLEPTAKRMQEVTFSWSHLLYLTPPGNAVLVSAPLIDIISAYLNCLCKVGAGVSIKEWPLELEHELLRRDGGASKHAPPLLGHIQLIQLPSLC